MENSDGASYGVVRWFGMSVAAAFFASIERCSCVNVTTSDSDDEDDEEAKDRPLMLTSLPSVNSAASSSFAVNQNVDVDAKTTPAAVEDLPV